MPKIHNLLRVSILLRLSKKPAHGYQLIQEMEVALHQNVSASHVYPFLRELEAKKWITVKKSGRTNVFSLTASGRKAADELLGHFSGLVEAAFSSKISICAHCECKVFDGGFKEAGKTYCCPHCAKAMAH
ncbi:PadR family transcriptional regulator [Candidatus Micrarchaeota archaeon]|nr:PadR family transcriptional regulator [Candidatus Micrarchaeota archaeon]